MSAIRIIAILLATFLAFAVLYGPQPLLPQLASEYGVPLTTAATIITWSLFPMCVAPAIVGIILRKVAAGRVIAFSIFSLAATGIAFSTTPVFGGMQLVRLLQGAVIAALLPAIMTFIATEAVRLRLVMASYVAASVLGGLAGRILLGVALGAGIPWRGYFAVLAAACLLSGFLTLTLARRSSPAARPVKHQSLAKVLATRPYAMLFGLIFGAFFVTTALLNFAPFRMAELQEGVSTSRIAYLYGGFLTGGAVSLLSVRVVDWLGTERRAILLGLAVLASAVLVASLRSLNAVGVAIALVATGFFLVHAVLAGFVNGLAGSQAPAVNGLYVSIYYAGGTLGSYVPGLVYVRHGWWTFVTILFLVTTVAALLGHLSLRNTSTTYPAST